MSSTLHNPASLFGGPVGALQQLVNELLARVPTPIGPLPDVPPGDLFEPGAGAGRDAADAVERFVDRLRPRSDVDPQAARLQRPLLLEATIASTGSGASTRLTIDATAPGAAWGQVGRESAMVAVYVDGRYHSTIIVHGERREPYEVNLGALPAGAHRIELRAAVDAAPVRAVVAGARAAESTGEQALVDRHAPIVELRDVDSSARNSVARSDAPLLLVPAITRHADGSRTIEYRMVWSNEDGGTAAPDLFARYGRGVDAEPMLRVRVAADGRVLEERYQAALHQWRRFDGERAGTRPILRVSTANSMVSARRSTRPVEVWSGASVAPVDASTGEFEVMRAHPWTWSVMAQELLREGKAAPADAVRGARQVGDPRRYVYLGAMSHAVRAAIAAAGGLELVLHDGRRIFAALPVGFGSGPFGQSAIELPRGVSADAVRGVALLGIPALVLDAAFGVRELARALTNA